VQSERDAFGDVIAALNASMRDTQFEALVWERLPASSGARPQALINEMVDECDVFVLVMFRIWGRRASDSPIASSYTEEEFKRAAARFNRTQAPEIFCFFKQVDLDVWADPGPQLQQVLKFRESIEQSHQVIYRSFATPADFSEDLRDHLKGYLEGRSLKHASSRRQILLSVPEDTGSTPDDWRAAEVLTSYAVLAARDGRMEQASLLFAEVAQQTTDIRLLVLAEDFFRQRGEAITALAVADRRLVLTRDRRRAALDYIATFPSLAQDVAANALPHLPPESHATFLEIVSEVFDSPDYKNEVVSYLAEHMTVPELLTLTRFFRGAGRTIVSKLGRYMGDTIPRAMEQVNARLRARGLIE
jgi:hypothetical protein